MRTQKEFCRSIMGLLEQLNLGLKKSKIHSSSSNIPTYVYSMRDCMIIIGVARVIESHFML